MVEWQQNSKGLKIPYLEGKPLCSRHDPLREAQMWAQKTKERIYKDTELLVVFGYGAGYHVAELRKVSELPIYVFEKIPELALGVNQEKDFKVFSLKTSNDIWGTHLLGQILGTNFQIFQHFSSSHFFSKDYDQLRLILTARTKQSLKRQIEAFVNRPELANLQIDQDSFLGAKEISLSPTIQSTTNPKALLWKILGDLVL